MRNLQSYILYNTGFTNAVIF